MKYIKANWKFFVFSIVMCIIGAYFTIIYSIDILDQSVIDKAVEQVGSKALVIGISVAQYSLYAVIFAALGIILSNITGLWKRFEITKNAVLATVIISVVGGLVLSIGDKYVFGSLLEPVKSLYDEKPDLKYIIMSFTYGGVFEEIMMRLFFMSLLVWLISKIFCRKDETIPIRVYVVANIISALLFAAGHIPSTIQTFGYMDGMLLFRCILMNGGFGLAFGWLYRRFGIQYSMLAHFGCHLISKLIWILFI